MIIYCNGDSHTSGVELADYLLPGYPNGTPTYIDSANAFDKEYLKRASIKGMLGLSDNTNSVLENRFCWYKATYDISHPLGKLRQSIIQKIVNEEFSRAWPNKLFNLSGYPVINNAQGGSSMDRIARTTVSDLISLKGKHTNIISIIGLTGINRSELPSSGLVRMGHDVRVNRSHTWADVTHHRPCMFPPRQAVLDFKLKYETDYHCYINFYKNIILIKNFCSVNNIRLYFVLPMRLPPKFRNDGLDNTYSYNDIESIRNLENYANLVPDIDIPDIANSCKLPAVYAPGGHYVEAIHEIVADKLFNIIKQ